LKLPPADQTTKQAMTNSVEPLNEFDESQEVEVMLDDQTNQAMIAHLDKIKNELDQEEETQNWKQKNE